MRPYEGDSVLIHSDDTSQAQEEVSAFKLACEKLQTLLDVWGRVEEELSL